MNMRVFFFEVGIYMGGFKYFYHLTILVVIYISLDKRIHLIIIIFLYIKIYFVLSKFGAASKLIHLLSKLVVFVLNCYKMKFDI